ncbi:TPA: chromosome partitioning protein ParB [Candidatus Komeilibacteria bacterium]|nr:chromosome partitioning protein ParB [Candidatus Komeilibacteria bacterium]HBR13497.1 chromosome partitioning protein ParB [Candidatus Komeilibacteria bacterium]HBV02570.1 chromosome partitioning protein ParB [Candidatus Komeilibacteria bacterium]
MIINVFYMDKGVLGRGLGSLIPNLSSQNQPAAEIFSGDVSAEKVIQAPLEKIERNPFQPRDNFDHEELEDLIESIKKHGIIQPLIVTKTATGYQLIAGERRLKSAQILGLPTAPVIVRSAQAIEKLELALVENIQRQNLNPIEEALAYHKLIDEFSLTQEEVGQRMGKKRATIANSLRLLDLPVEIQQALISRQITSGHAKVILSQETNQARLRLFKKIIDSTLSVRATEHELKRVRVKSYQRVLTHDVETQAQEDRLRQALGTKVSIIKKNDRGQINIEFYSAEELNHLTDKIAP